MREEHAQWKSVTSIWRADLLLMGASVHVVTHAALWGGGATDVISQELSTLHLAFEMGSLDES